MLRIKSSSEDIISVDKKVRKGLVNKDTESIAEKKRRIDEINKILSKFTNILQYRDLTLLKDEGVKLQKEIDDALYNEHLAYYIEQTSKYIEKYKSMLKEKVSISFVKKGAVKSKNLLEKEKIISEYLKIAREFVNIENIIAEKGKNKQDCSCGGNTFDIDDNIYTCIDCGEQKEKTGGISSYNDINRINTSNKYTYDRRVHFRDTVYQYQGKQNSTVKQEVYDQLEKKFKLHKLLSKSNVRCEKYKHITKEHIYLFLKENGHSRHYEDITLIYCKITGKKPPDLSEIEAELFEEHEKMLQIYEKIKTDGRKNFLNAKYVLYQLLLKRRIKCDREDFNVLKTADRLDYHNETCKKIFDMLEWSFTYIQ